MTEPCDDCAEIKQLRFRVEGLDLDLQRKEICMNAIKQQQESRDVEHELIINNLSTRMDTLREDMDIFKKELKGEMADVKSSVKEDVANIRKDIPDMFDQAVNKLLAQIGKWFLIGAGIFLLVSILAWNRPFVVSFLEEILKKAQTTEIVN